MEATSMDTTDGATDARTDSPSGEPTTPPSQPPAMATAAPAQPTTSANAAIAGGTSKTLKRCLSVPIIHMPGAGSAMTTRSAAAAAAAAAAARAAGDAAAESALETPKKYQSGDGAFAHNIHIHIPRSNPSSREVSPAPVFNIFAPRARRYSASYSLGAAAAAAAAGGGTSGGTPLCLTPRVSQLRQEECIDMNSREVNHEREVHSAMQMSQSWEDLTLVAENWSCKSDEFSNPLQVTLPPASAASSVNAGGASCSSPSPTSTRANLRLPYGLSPSPTRRTFSTRRSMSPIAMRPSALGPVKRKFEMEDSNFSNWNVYSQPPAKKIFTESRGSSPVCQSPSSICPSPDSGTYDGRITPKLFISKLCTINNNNNGCGGSGNVTNSSACSSPLGGVHDGASGVGGTTAATGGATSALLASSLSGSSSSSSSYSSSMSGGCEPMLIGSNIDEGISLTEGDELKAPPLTLLQQQQQQQLQQQQQSSHQHHHHHQQQQQQVAMATELQDEATLMDDLKSETSSIGGCSSVSVDSISFDGGTTAASKTTAAAATTFLNKLSAEDVGGVGCGVGGGGGGRKNFYINKQGLSGAKKFIVNHDDLPPSIIVLDSVGSVADATRGKKHAAAAAADGAKTSAGGRANL